MSAEQFRDARVFAGFTRCQAAEFLAVSLRTVGHWETGKARAPYAAFKLLRVYRHGDLIDPRWAAFRLVRGKLVTPENHEIAPSDLTWLSLLVRRADALSDLLRARDRAAAVAPSVAGAPASVASTDPRGPQASQAGVLSGRTDGGAEPRVEQRAIGRLDRSVRLPPSNRGVSEFRNGAGRESVGSSGRKTRNPDSQSLSEAKQAKPPISAQAAPREALGLVAS